MTIAQLLDEQIETLGEHEALVYVDPPLRYSYREFGEMCKVVAKGFLKMGIAAGDHLAVWANNVPEWVVAQFASSKMGAVLVTVNTNYRQAELEYLLEHSDSKTLILIDGIRGREYLDTIYAICPELHDCKPGELKSQRLPLLKNVVYIGDESMPGMFSWQDIVEMGKSVKDEDLQERQNSLHAEDAINIQYTSGTTGFPKGVMLTHNNLIGNARSIVECLRLTEKDRLCIPVPFFHCFGCVLGTLVSVVSGATMVPVVSFRAPQVLEAIVKEKCTVIHGVPTMFIAELEEMQKQNYEITSLRTGVMAGATCPIEVMKSVVEVMGAEEICIAYGQTEASPVVTMTRTNDPIDLRVSTVGRALENVEVKIIDEDGKTVANGVQGELCSRGYLVMKGYYKMPEATAKAIDKDGWLHSGDLAIMDENGYCRITGRLKDMIIRGGENIYPREIEEFLYQNEKIKDVQVVGVVSEKYGEEVAAFIQLKEGQSADEQEIQEFCKEKISWHKIPKYVFFIEEYPTTASGKVQKYKLQEIAAEKLGRS
ncbi:AMP-binding protein [Candidatus Uabimicrobium amorphum]